ncbi:MAG: hypothetical protein WBM44_22295 [Waterburya sp.]
MEIWVDQVVGLVELVENSHQPAIALLRGQYAIGNVEVRILQY